MPNLNVGLVAAVVMGLFISVSAVAAIPSSTGLCAVGGPYISLPSGATSITTLPASTICTARGYVMFSPTKTGQDPFYVGYCTGCKAGFTLTDTTIDASAYGCGTITYQTCGSSVIGPVNPTGCTSDSDCGENTTSSPAQGYVKSVTHTCNTATGLCSTSTTYKCDYQYYGTATCSDRLAVGCSGCTACPDDSEGRRGELGAGNGNNENDCFLKPARAFNDTSGTYRHAGVCNFKGCSSNTVTGLCSETSGTVNTQGTPSSTEGYYCWCCTGGKCAYLETFYYWSSTDATMIANCNNNCASDCSSNFRIGTGLYNALECNVINPLL